MNDKRILLNSNISNFLFFVIFSFFNISYCLIENFHFHRATKLNNGNFLLFSCNGMYLLSPDLKTIILNSGVTKNNYEENIAHFLAEDGGYILYISYSNNYLFSQEGNFIKNYEYSLNKRNYYQYSIIPYKLENGYLNYYLIYFQNASTLIFKRFEYNLNTNNTSPNSNKDFFYNISPDNTNAKGFISCEIMRNKSINVIACFLGTSLNNNNYINCTVFYYNFTVNNISQTQTGGINKFYNIKSSLMTIDGRKKVLIIAKINHVDNADCIFYAGYNINTNSFKEGIIKDKTHCILNAGYIYNTFIIETEQFIVSYLNTNCKSFNQNNENNFIIYSFDKNFNNSFFGTIRNFVLAPKDQTSNSICSQLNTYSEYWHSIVFSSYTQRYCFIGNFNVSNK